jgi:DUF2934 family protein
LASADVREHHAFIPLLARWVGRTPRSRSHFPALDAILPRYRLKALVRALCHACINPARRRGMDQTLTDRIRERAYEIWVASGCPHGAAGDHWLAAEREILNAPQTAAERESLDAPQTALAAQSPMVKKSSRARRAAAKRK